ncbi:MAG: Asp-tRNA(Asn)/Glu-tRNA(Gln) amidotransferase subunit GatC [Longicatena sp.]
METFSSEYFEKLAHDIMFEVSAQEVAELKEEFKVLCQQIDVLNEIDTEGVEEMIYPFEAPTTFLREDVVENVISQEEVFTNVKNRKAGHIHVPKVVK